MAQKKIKSQSSSNQKGPGRDKNKERQWRERMARWRRSGMEIRAFCRQHNVPETAFYFWRRELARRSTPARATQRLVPVRLTHRQVASPTTSGITLQAGNGILLRLERDFDPVTLRRVLVVVGDMSC